MTVEVDPRTYDKLMGETLANRYQIESRLGEGAMGAVYKARHIKVGRAFAVKVLHPRLLEDVKVLQRFEREAELAGRLRHPNVIGVVDVGETHDGLRYMVMDFAEGPDLASMLSEAPFSAERVMLLTKQLLEGLYHAHEQGLIHRDFKPENVIVERDTHGVEVPRIVDFGIAILREGGESVTSPGRLTTNGLVLGTPHYMAPEQAVADPIDHRIDLFALGIMVYEMLCGKLPFDGSGAEVARANLLLDPPLIAERVPYLDIDPLLEAFARRMMAKKRDLRPATAKVARELLDLIERDREAAAASLGVPLGAARLPQTTQPVTPVVRHASHDGTFPPPIREASEKAKPVRQPTPLPARAQSEPRYSSVEPAPRRKLPLIAAGIVGLGIVGGAAAVVLIGGDDKKQQPPKVAVAEPAATQPVPTPVAPAADKGPVEVPPPQETKPVAPVASPSTAPATSPSTTPVTTSANPAKLDPKTATLKQPKGKQPTKTTKVETKPNETKPVETKPIETKPVETPKTVDAGMLAAQYKQVGAQLKELETAKGAEATSDLWSRYRFIRIAEAMATQQKRDEAAAILSKLTREIAARKN